MLSLIEYKATDMADPKANTEMTGNVLGDNGTDPNNNS